MTFTLRHKLNLLLEAMEIGMEVRLSSDDVLGIPEDGEEPGFVMSRQVHDSKTGRLLDEHKHIYQIGSDTAWMSLIYHAQEMTENDVITLGGTLALNMHKRRISNRTAL